MSNFIKSKLLFSLVIVIISCLGNVNAQEKSIKGDQNKDCLSVIDNVFGKKVYVSVDSMPKFQEGVGSILKYIKSKFRVPEDIKDFQGSFTSVFIIDVDGTLKAARIKGKCKSNMTELEIQVLDMYRNMPKWKPGKCNSKIVPVKVTFTFKL